MTGWVAGGLYLVFFGCCLVTWAITRLIATLHDIIDGVADNIVQDDNGWPVIAVAKPKWDADA